MCNHCYDMFFFGNMRLRLLTFTTSVWRLRPRDARARKSPFVLDFGCPHAQHRAVPDMLLVLYCMRNRPRMRCQLLASLFVLASMNVLSRDCYWALVDVVWWDRKRGLKQRRVLVHHHLRHDFGGENSWLCC